MFKSNLLALLLVPGLLMGAPIANAQGLLEQCSDDIEFYCTDVEPGDGRVLACLYAHSATISDPCHEATDDMARLLERFFDRIGEVSDVCTADFQTHCATVTVGEGSGFQCLRAAGDNVSAECRSALESLPEG
ncbi:MAG: cysteine rich repeat-containing protein [Pseudomonadota bacterium]